MRTARRRSEALEGQPRSRRRRPASWATGGSMRGLAPRRRAPTARRPSAGPSPTDPRGSLDRRRARSTTAGPSTVRPTTSPLVRRRDLPDRHVHARALVQARSRRGAAEHRHGWRRRVPADHEGARRGGDRRGRYQLLLRHRRCNGHAHGGLRRGADRPAAEPESPRSWARGVIPETDAAWHHAAATYDGTTWRLFLDGNLDASLAVGRPANDQTNVITAFGTSLSTATTPAPQGFFAGSIDEIRIWNVARSQVADPGLAQRLYGRSDQHSLIGRVEPQRRPWSRPSPMAPGTTWPGRQCGSRQRAGWASSLNPTISGGAEP